MADQCSNGIDQSKVAAKPNGQIPSSDITTATEPHPSTNNGTEDSSDQSHDLATPVTIKKTPSVPSLTVKEEEDGCVVKSKPYGHSRKGSSISQLSVGGVGSSGCSMSRGNSSYSVSADAISLPLTLEQLKNDTSAHTTSDPALRLTADLSRGDLSDEQRHETLTKLLEEVVALKLELVNLREENEMLRRARTDMDDELHQLTENLFEEAYKMVDEAKGGKADAEKRLMDAAGHIEAMETKVFALNNLIQTSPSSSPVTPHKHHKRSSVKKIIRKISKKPKKISELKESEPLLKEGEFMTEEFMTFKTWLDKGVPTSVPDDPYLASVKLLQIDPCLKFKNSELSEKVKECVENNAIIIEPLAGSTISKEAFKVPCVLTNESSHPCSFRMKLGENEEWCYISSFARNRIVCVCDFYILIGYVQKGIVKKEPLDLFWQMTKLRGAISLAMLNLVCQEPLS